MAKKEPQSQIEPSITRDEYEKAIGRFGVFLLKSSSNSILQTHFHFDKEGEHKARGAVQNVVKIELPRLRTEIESDIPESAALRVCSALDDVDKAAWELMVAIDGVRTNEIAHNRRIVPGPWVEPMTRLSTAVDRASWIWWSDVRLVTLGRSKTTTAEKARLKAEAIVKLEGWPQTRGRPSKNAMAKKVGCSPATLKDAMEESPKLRKAYYARPSRGTGGTADRDAELDELLADQQLDARSRHA